MRRKVFRRKRSGRPLSILVVIFILWGMASAAAPAGLGHQPVFIPIFPPHPVGWNHYDNYAVLAAEHHGIPVDMFLRLLHVENFEGNPSAVNPNSGATGLAQFMPATAAIFNIDPCDPHGSLYASAQYLKELHQKFAVWEHAVMAYNWGPGNVKKWLASGKLGSMPAETAAYIRRIEP